MLQPLATRRNIDLWLDGKTSLIHGDQTLMNGVLENLIGNAIKFSPVGSEVKVQVAPTSPRQVLLVVEDSGEGFPNGALTEAFVRGESKVEGFGLGLAVVKQVVEAYGGQLILGKASNGGARVEVILPV